MSFLRRVWAYIVSLPKVYSIGGAVIIVAVVLVTAHALTRPATTPDAVSNISHVTIESIASLSSAAGPLPVTGTVTSLDQATILAETSGEITSLRVAIGSQVSAGQIIAEFENSSQEAALLQAQGSYDAAEAALANASGPTAANAGITSSQASQSAANSATSAVAALQSAYAALDDAVHTKADTMFSNPRTITPTLNLTVPNNQLVVTLQNERGQLEGVLSDASTISSDTSSSDIDSNITAMTADAQTVITFLNNLVAATNDAVTSQNVTPAQLAAFQASAGAARTEAVNAVTSLTAAKSAYDTAAANAQTSSNTAGGSTANNVASAQANVKEALGALDSAEASLEKTIVRSPISGTIVSLPVTNGDFVASFAQVAQVSNSGALEVNTYVTPDDAKTLAVGGQATINGTVAGVITSIAPALDPTTGKILVKLGITGSSASLTDGDTVTVSLVRSTPSAAAESANASSTAILIPITAAKITPTGAVVFTVASSTLVAHPITLGTILGDQVTVLTGATLDMDIVVDARGLAAGQTVVVDSQ